MPDDEHDRGRLVDADREVMRDFDKTILTLGAGALGISLAFIKDIAPHPEWLLLLVVSWAALTLSILAILVSEYASHWAILKAIVDLDEGEAGKLQGGCSTWATEGLNIIALVSLIKGVAALLLFALVNLGD